VMMITTYKMLGVVGVIRLQGRPILVSIFVTLLSFSLLVYNDLAPCTLYFF